MVVIYLLLLTGLGYLVYESQHRICYCYCPCSKNGREMEFEQYEAGYAEGGIFVNYYWQMRSCHIKLRRSIMKNGATEKAETLKLWLV